MKTQKIKLFKTWHKLLIAAIWVGMTGYFFSFLLKVDGPYSLHLYNALKIISYNLTNILGTLAISAGFAAFATAFPYMFLRNHLASKAGLPLAAGGAGWDNDFSQRDDTPYYFSYDDWIHGRES